MKTDRQKIRVVWPLKKSHNILDCNDAISSPKRLQITKIQISNEDRIVKKPFCCKLTKNRGILGIGSLIARVCVFRNRPLQGNLNSMLASTCYSMSYHHPGKTTDIIIFLTISQQFIGFKKMQLIGYL